MAFYAELIYGIRGMASWQPIFLCKAQLPYSDMCMCIVPCEEWGSTLIILIYTHSGGAVAQNGDGTAGGDGAVRVRVCRRADQWRAGSRPPPANPLRPPGHTPFCLINHSSPPSWGGFFPLCPPPYGVCDSWTIDWLEAYPPRPGWANIRTIAKTCVKMNSPSPKRRKINKKQTKKKQKGHKLTSHKPDIPPLCGVLYFIFYSAFSFPPSGERIYFYGKCNIENWRDFHIGCLPLLHSINFNAIFI